MQKLGVMGGTFDPIHVGHLAAASEAMDVLGLDEVVFVPAGRPPHKVGREIAPAEDRVAMVHLAIASNPRFTLSRVDVDREGPSFTVDTLRDLKKERGEVELYFISGADSIASMPTWENSEGLFELAQFVGVSRPGVELDCSVLPEGRVHALEVPAMAISSTEIRQRIREDRSVWYLLPDAVLTYVGKRHLYGSAWQGYGSQ